MDPICLEWVRGCPETYVIWRSLKKKKNKIRKENPMAVNVAYFKKRSPVPGWGQSRGFLLLGDSVLNNLSKPGFGGSLRPSLYLFLSLNTQEDGQSDTTVSHL